MGDGDIGDNSAAKGSSQVQCFYPSSPSPPSCPPPTEPPPCPPPAASVS